jgi:hypothetical protein
MLGEALSDAAYNHVESLASLKANKRQKKKRLTQKSVRSHWSRRRHRQ